MKRIEGSEENLLGPRGYTTPEPTTN